jgi:hypothetical protein
MPTSQAWRNRQNTPPPPPDSGTFYSLQKIDGPPLPFDPFPDRPFIALGGGLFLFDDLEIDYMRFFRQSQPHGRPGGVIAYTSPTPPGDDGGSNTVESATGSLAYNYSTNDFYIQIDGITNDLAFLRLRGPVDTNRTNHLVMSKTDLNALDWKPERLTNGITTTNLIIEAVPTRGNSNMFFEAAKSDTIVQIVKNDIDAVEPTDGDAGQEGSFIFSRDGATSSDLTIFYRIGGTASNGIDYTNLTGNITIGSGDIINSLSVLPAMDSLLEFDETVTLTLIVTNGYVVDPDAASATVNIIENLFTNIVVAGIPSPVGIDYNPVINALIVSVGASNNFVRIDANGATNLWSGVHGLPEEIKLATVKTTAGGFTNGVMFYGNGTNGSIGRMSADGSNFTNSWVNLANETLLRGSLYVDQTGTFDHDLIAVTGGAEGVGGGVWRIGPSGTNRLANITNTHLEGVITLTNDATLWGPWAGRILAGAEDRHLIFAIATNGAVTQFDLGIRPEDFDIIHTNQNLYCTDPERNLILKLPGILFAGHDDHLLITQAGEVGQIPKLFIVYWDNSTSKFVVQSITYRFPPNFAKGHFEHVTFAPIDIPTQ